MKIQQSTATQDANEKPDIPEFKKRTPEENERENRLRNVIPN